MTKKSVKAIAESIIEPIVESLGYELVDVEYKNPGGPWKLSIYIYKEGGIGFDDCELVSKTLDPILDANEEIAEKYDFFQVSSPGLDREFKNLKDYKRYIGKKIEVSLYAAVNGTKKLTGLLKQADEENIIIESDNGEIKLDLKDIGKASPAIEF
ncbi:MAG: ribosome maturation factor RimP [Clostridia bacterium]|nr:ribosome maturation factor RimP [Clostridia bacterium]